MDTGRLQEAQSESKLCDHLLSIRLSMELDEDLIEFA